MQDAVIHSHGFKSYITSMQVNAQTWVSKYVHLSLVMNSTWDYWDSSSKLIQFSSDPYLSTTEKDALAEFLN